VQFIEMVIQKTNPVIYRALGIYLPLITTNCAVLGVTFLNTDSFFVNAKPIPGSFLYSVFQGFFAGVGFSLVLLLMSSIRQRLELCDPPKSLEGTPIAFITASLMSLAFMGFGGWRF
jgi:electron transport complex protein RnfA